MSYVYLDIETGPGQKPTLEDLFAKIKPSANCKSDEARKKSIDKQKKEILDDSDAKLDEAWRKQSTDKFKCEVICVGYQVDNSKPKTITKLTPVLEEGSYTINTIYREGDRERGIMEKFDEEIGELRKKGVIKWVHCNGNSFDIPILYLRAIKYNCKNLLATLPKSNRDRNTFDLPYLFTPTIWSSVCPYSLSTMCEWLDIPVKSDGICGADVFDIYLNEGHEGLKRIADYCCEDVSVLPVIFDKLGLKTTVPDKEIFGNLED